MITGWKNVLATHEEPQELASGPWLGDQFPGVALPSSRALKRWVIVRSGNLWTVAQVADVGPWCIDDDHYVFGLAMPRAQRFEGQRCPRTLSDLDSIATLPNGKACEVCNGAGIDLFPRVARELGISTGDNVRVDWQFFEL